VSKMDACVNMLHEYIEMSSDQHDDASTTAAAPEARATYQTESTCRECVNQTPPSNLALLPFTNEQTVGRESGGRVSTERM
jgi:hypothetical protein